LNKLPVLKSFLKGGEAASYEGVTVKFVAGRSAIMSIYEADGSKVEEVALHELKTKEEMHALMVEKGFHLKEPETVARIQAEHKAELDAEATKRQEQLAQLRNRKPGKRGEFRFKNDQDGSQQRKAEAIDVVNSSAVSYGNMFALYAMVSLALSALFVVQRGRKKRRTQVIAAK